MSQENRVVTTRSQCVPGELKTLHTAPASAVAAPTIYRARQGGRQYIVIASRGHGKAPGPKLGDSVVAFALPEARRPLKPCPSTPGLTNRAPGLPRRSDRFQGVTLTAFPS